MHVVARNPAPQGRIPSETPQAPDAHGIPQGFVALDAMKALPMMGRWAPLPDGLPGWLPFHALVEMARREQAGDDAARHWLEVYRHAVQGDTAAQRRMGGACERGSAASVLTFRARSSGITVRGSPATAPRASARCA